jgi:ABC-type transport system involved in cytochrome c biogenesis ATPase subunit
VPIEKRSTRARRSPLEEPPEPFGRLVRYEITGLFGQHSHAFDLEPEEPTILTGANGTGKSTILRSINAVGTGSWHQLLNMPFKSLTLRFENAPLLRATKLKGVLKLEHAGEECRLDPNAPGPGGVGIDRGQMELFQAEYAALFERDPALARREMTRRMRDPSIPEPLWAKGMFDGPEFLRKIPAGFAVRFVTDQRLVIYGDRAGRPRQPRDSGEDVRAAVAEYAQDLRRQIGHELARYAAASQRQDREFPQLVVQAMSSGEDIHLADVRALLESVGKRRQALERVGLLESDVSSVPQFQAESLELENVSPVIKTFAEVTLRKFETLEPFRRRLQLFVDFLDQHFVEKRAVTTDERGLMFELSNGETVRPNQLSSGEQQMLVLAYQLLFETSAGTLLLVDEPELSLHVGWQSSFVDDISAMGRDRGLQFLLASHSPVLIGAREDLKRSLDKPRR